MNAAEIFAGKQSEGKNRQQPGNKVQLLLKEKEWKKNQVKVDSSNRIVEQNKKTMKNTFQNVEQKPPPLALNERKKKKHQEENTNNNNK